MRALLLVSLSSLVGCDLVFDGNAPVIPVIGAPPDTSGLPRLNLNRATSRSSLITGPDGAPWAFFEEALPGGDGAAFNGRRLVRLVPPEASELIASNDVLAGETAVYVFDRGTDMAPAEVTRLVVRSPGEAPLREFTLPKGPGLTVLGPLDQVFVYVPLVAGATQALMHRRDGTFSRTLALPARLDPTHPPGDLFELAPDERTVLERHPDGRLLLHDTAAERTIDLRVRLGTAAFDCTGRLLITCGEDGVRAVPVDGSEERVLDAGACSPPGGLAEQAGQVYYAAGDGLRRVRLDGGAPPVLVAAGGVRALAFDAGVVAYSREPNDLFAHEAGDGFVGDWMFMRRGVEVAFSSDGRLHWLEDAAKMSPVGDLHSATVGTLPRKLTLNVAKYDVLADGRLIAADQHPFRGDFNRVIVIDEAAGIARYVASRATGYTLVPGSSDVLVDFYTGPDTHDIVRVALPPR